ncbi:MAG: UDP-N-acetylmuramate dehydrogenase [Acidimicrobiia bacterium]|nr:UDP-N-acetylmuramate dehydrogenase [Acidimicrobiia bacterium]MDH5288851.1 UDP-N-acetylmuramate dehydrogenase [Acidimicrobiia bacterium]
MALLDDVARRLGPLARRQVPLAPLCTYRVGGPAALFVTIERPEALDVVAATLAAAGGRAEPHGTAPQDGADGDTVPVLVLGRGSNLLVADVGFPGLVVQLGDAFATVTPDRGDARLRLGGAALLPVAARRSAAESLHGFEWAVGVPGSVGGAVRMNAGGHGSDMAASVASVSVFDLRAGQGLTWGPADLDFAYRRSAVAPHHVVLEAVVQLGDGRREESEAAIAEIVRWRRAHQPGGQNAGSVFTNPPGDSAGRMIDAAGLKGLRVGTAEVSTKHANFIQADPGGSADDVARLITEVRRRVWDHFGVALHCENLLVGFDAPDGEEALR